MKRLKGPELKMPEMKVPPFVSDLYWDLRDRRLLPLVALVVVAIVAVPFLLGGSSEKSSGPSRVAVTPPAVSGGANNSTLVAVQAAPGLRSYHKRLSHRSPNNPFKQRYTAPQLDGSELGGELSSTSTTTTTTDSSNGKSTTTTTTTDTTQGGTAPKGPLNVYTVSATVQIVRTETKDSGGKNKSKQVRSGVLPPAPLPNKKTQLVAFMGISPQTQHPLFLVSDAVTGIFGESTCLSGAATCQLLEVNIGFPVTLVFGSGKVRYKINVLKVKAVSAGRYEPGKK